MHIQKLRALTYKVRHAVIYAIAQLSCCSSYYRQHMRWYCSYSGEILFFFALEGDTLHGCKLIWNLACMSRVDHHFFRFPSFAYFLPSPSLLFPYPRLFPLSCIFCPSRLHPSLQQSNFTLSRLFLSHLRFSLNVIAAGLAAASRRCLGFFVYDRPTCQNAVWPAKPDANMLRAINNLVWLD